MSIELNKLINGAENQEITEYVGKAFMLHQNIMGNFELSANHLVEACRLLKEMRDSRLYTYLGYEEFDDYAESAAGIKKRQAYNYISVYEKLGKEFLQSNAQIGITKLELLTKTLPSEREELIAENDLEKITVEELKEKIAELESHAKQMSLFEEENEDLKSKLEEEQQKNAEAEEASQRIKALEEENKKLLEENKELSERPVDVAVQEISEKEKEKIRKEIKAELQKESKASEKEKIDKAVENAKKEALKQFESDKKKREEEAAEKLRNSLSEIEKEKASAIDRARELEKKLEINNNSCMVKFEYLFEECQSNFTKLLQLLSEVSQSDADTCSKLTNATLALIDTIKDTIGAEK